MMISVADALLIAVAPFLLGAATIVGMTIMMEGNDDGKTGRFH